MADGIDCGGGGGRKLFACIGSLKLTKYKGISYLAFSLMKNSQRLVPSKVDPALTEAWTELPPCLKY